jgi:hypothetical protein
VFGNGNGRDRVLDLNASHRDSLLLDDDLWSGSLSAGGVVSRYAKQVGNDIQLDFGSGDVLTLVGRDSLTLLERMIDIA